MKRRLAEVPDKLLEGGEQALVEVADLMVGYWKIGAKVDTGAYRDSVRRERGSEGPTTRVMRVRAGGYIVNPKTGRLVNYAGILEERYHTGENAWLQVRGQVADIVRRMCLQQLKTIEVAGVLKFG